MSSSSSATGGDRNAIMGKIRSAVASADGPGGDKRRAEAVAARLAAKTRHPTPSRVAGKPADELVATFGSYLEACSATVVETAKAGVPSAIAKYLRDTNQPSRVRMGGDAYLAGLDWSREPTLTRLSGRAEPADDVGLSLAVAGVAETGTLVLASGPDNPVTLNYLPETHIIVVKRGDIVGPYEDALARITQRHGAGQMPRTVNLVSGASRTGDIGGRIVMGAHGPRNLCVIIVND